MKIELKNFQAHGDTVLNVKNGFVCVLGTTNSGKSSIVRALRWCFYDSLRGRRFIRFGENEASVTVDFGDALVQRIKGASKNVYKVNDLLLQSVGVGVPPEVSKAIGISLLQVEKNADVELHVSSQMKSPFLLMESDSYKSKALNVLTGSNVFDVAIKSTKSKIKDAEDGQKTAEATIETVSKQLEAFKDLEAQEVRIGLIERDLVSFETVNQKITSLMEIQSSQTKLFTDILDTRERLGKMEQAIGVVAPLVERLVNLELVLSTLNECQRVRVNINSFQLELSKADQTINMISPKIERMQAIESSLVLVRSASILNLDLDCLKREINLLDSDIERVRTELLNQPDSTCKECGQAITRQAREALV